MRNYYIFRSCRLKKVADTLCLIENSNDEVNGSEKEKKENKIFIPINDIDSIYIFSDIDLNSRLLDFLSKNNIVVHFYNYYGYYIGSFYSREFLISGEVIVRQSEKYLDINERLYLAKQFVKAAVYNSIQTLRKYISLSNIEEKIDQIQELYKKINVQNSINKLMAIEGNVKSLYYSCFEEIMNYKFEFKKRIKNPPVGPINALISFLNSLMYSEVLKFIYQTQLNPSISYLHEPYYRRFSLALDVAEIFKPFFCDRILFYLINNNMIKKNHFDKNLNYSYLLESGRKIVVKEFEDRLNKTVYIKKLKKKIKYKNLIKLELYKLIKHILNDKKYKALKIEW